MRNGSAVIFVSIFGVFALETAFAFDRPASCPDETWPMSSEDALCIGSELMPEALLPDIVFDSIESSMVIGPDGGVPIGIQVTSPLPEDWKRLSTSTRWAFYVGVMVEDPESRRETFLGDALTLPLTRKDIRRGVTGGIRPGDYRLRAYAYYRSVPYRTIARSPVFHVRFGHEHVIAVREGDESKVCGALSQSRKYYIGLVSDVISDERFFWEGDHARIAPQSTVDQDGVATTYIRCVDIGTHGRLSTWHSHPRLLTVFPASSWTPVQEDAKHD